MKLKSLNEIFDIKYGNQFDLYKLESDETSDINFVSRSSENLGVVCKVSRYKDIEPFPAGLITVTLGGTYLLSSFVQQDRFYTGQNVKVLTPKREMSLSEKIFYCKAIELNRPRYTSHGREANITLNALLVPAQVPKEFIALNADSLRAANSNSISRGRFQLNQDKWEWFRYDQLFTIKKGSRIVNSEMRAGQTRCIRPIETNNGIHDYIDAKPNHEGNTITVSYNGSVAEAFYQPEPYFALDDINVLYPKFRLNPYIAMFLVTLIRLEKYRFNYGRKWHLGRMKESLIKLPAKKGRPDFEFMEKYIKSLPYSASIQQHTHAAHNLQTEFDF